jgi:formylglycine-generating enzyme
MKKVFALAAAVALLGLSGIAQANVFDLGPGLTNLEMVTVGDPGNTADTRYGSYGAVDYTYNIGKYEVTTAQYADFLNHKAKSDPYGLYSYAGVTGYNYSIIRTGTPGDYVYTNFDNRPVNYVSFWNACRFVNWLNNGQGDGDTETGAYTLNGYNGIYLDAPQCRNSEAKWFLPNEDEWYKAAYYKGGGTNAGYRRFPMEGDVVSHATASYENDIPRDVGTYRDSGSAYGTFDQAGNLREWNETPNGRTPGVRGGSYYDQVMVLAAESRLSDWPDLQQDHTGFRVASTAPEPASLIALAGGLVGLVGTRRRRP